MCGVTGFHAPPGYVRMLCSGLFPDIVMTASDKVIVRSVAPPDALELTVSAAGGMVNFLRQHKEELEASLLMARCAEPPIYT